MALNVEQITARLAQMPDAALQKYAAMNKNDPYIMALAVSESNRRKQMRQAAQGAQGQIPQPKVVDAAVQGMAAPMPEEMGIARLPAGDMNFADGGIVAFADGGDVERYQFGGSTSAIDRILQKPPQARTPEENAMLAQAGYDVQTRTLGPDSGVSGVNTFLQGIGPRMRDYFTGGASRLSDEELSQKPAAGGAATERILRGLGMGQATAPLGPQASYSNEGRRQPGLFAEPTLTPPTASGAGRAAPKADATQRGSGAGSAAGAAGAAPNMSGNLASLEALHNRLQKPQEKEYAEVDKERTALAEKMRAFGKTRLADFEAEEAKRGDVFKGREERLAQREGELGKLKEQGLGLALLQAGAAMMSTPGSVGMALGKGIDVGAKQYAAGIDKINLAKDRLLEARDRLEELRVNRDDLTAKERRQLKGEADRYVMEADRLTMEGAEKKLGYNREDRKTLFAGMTTILGQEIGAGATLGAARIRSQDQKDYLEALRGGSMVETARKNIMSEIIKANPYADEATRQMLFQKEWTKALQNNPALAKYTGVASGGGGASSADPLGLR